jgi:cell shape-determining protein MreC
MKMSYLRHNRDKNQGRKKKLYFSVFFLFLLFLTVFFYLNPFIFSNSAHYLASSVWRFNFDIKERVSFPSFFTDKESLIIENKELKEKIKNLEVVVFERDALKIDNKELRDLLDMRPIEDTSLSRVLARPPQVPYDVLIIDGGKDRNFSKGNKVLYGQSLLLGELEEVYGKTSRVVLYSSAGKETKVFVDNQDHALTAYGKGGGQFFLEVPRKTKIDIGSFLLKIENRVNLLGEVVEVFLPETGALKFVYAKVPIDIFSVKEVFVLSVK